MQITDLFESGMARCFQSRQNVINLQYIGILYSQTENNVCFVLLVTTVKTISISPQHMYCVLFVEKIKVMSSYFFFFQVLNVQNSKDFF